MLPTTELHTNTECPQALFTKLSERSCKIGRQLSRIYCQQIVVFVLRSFEYCLCGTVGTVQYYKCFSDYLARVIVLPTGNQPRWIMTTNLRIICRNCFVFRQFCGQWHDVRVTMLAKSKADHSLLHRKTRIIVQIPQPTSMPDAIIKWPTN